MPNTFLTPDMIAREALAHLYEWTHMANLVHRDYEADFDGQVGDTITVRKPATFTADTFDRVAGITIQNATETGVPVVLDTLLDVSFEVTAEQLSLDIRDFGAQLLAPAMEAISQGVDLALLGLRADVLTSVPTVAGNAADSILARKALNDANVPLSDRHGVIDTALAADWLGDTLFHQADQRGDTMGLQEASIGRKFGVDWYETQNIANGLSVAFHRTAFALVSRTLALPAGVDATRAAAVGYKGLGLRVIYDYDISKKQDVVSIDTLIGVATLDQTRAVILDSVTP